jgi:hypothetical protein
MPLGDGEGSLDDLLICANGTADLDRLAAGQDCADDLADQG